MKKVFIDGSAGTTGLRIRERLAERTDLSLTVLPEEDRKNIKRRIEAIRESDVAFLCLPDAAAVEIVEYIDDSDTVIIDTSTAHRTDVEWCYGFAELQGMREKIQESRRIANPGCHASGFIALVEPLVRIGIIPDEANLCCFSLTGYSGGGKKMITEYETENRNVLLDAPRQYGLSQQHKHLKEMKKISHLKNSPVFCPIVSDYYSGMEVTVPLFASQINGNLQDICSVYKSYYQGRIVHFEDNPDNDGLLSAGALSGKDSMSISAFGNDERIILTARFDNLGKGASGAAIQNMNIVLGVEETCGLNL